MAKPYFRQVPNFEYVSRNPGDKYISEYISTKNLFKRGKLREDIFGNLSFFEKYSIIGDERPDNVAYKFYGEETLDWVVLLSNNILNIQTEWPMPQSVFDRVMLERYGSYDNLFNGTHHYETQEIKNSSGITVLKGGLKISPTWKTNGNFVESYNDKIYNLYAGDGIVASTKVIVELFKPIPNLKVGNEITIENMLDNEYNGTFIVTEIINEYLTENEKLVISSFAFQLPSVPNDPDPLGTMYSQFTAIYEESKYEIVVYSGDGVDPSTTATVDVIDGIPGLTIGDSIIIENISEAIYNGTFTVTDILQEEDGVVLSFSYELSEIPEDAFPTREPIQDIRVYENVSERFVFQKIETESFTSDEIEISSSSYYYEYWDAALASSTLVPSTSFVRSVSNYEYENQLQDEKRNIYVLKPKYLNIIFDDIEDIMTYKRGSQQYVAKNLKRGDNIRLYE